MTRICEMNRIVTHEMTSMCGEMTGMCESTRICEVPRICEMTRIVTYRMISKCEMIRVF